MKTSKTIIWMFVIIAFFYASKSFAINRDLFPNINSVQPIPTGLLPNISGNIDWPNVPGEQDPNASTNTNNSTNPNYQNSPGNTVTNQNNGSNINAPNAIENNSGTQNSLGNYPSSNSSNGTQNSDGTYGSFGSFGNPQNNPYPSSFDSGTTSFSESENGQTQNEQTQNASTENVESPDSSVTKQDNKQPQGAISQSTYSWALTFGSMILLVVAFIIWKFKKTPDDVN